ncbi:MAG: hypothetical protein AAF865_02615 [Pseudomonadota bacterium]
MWLSFTSLICATFICSLSGPDESDVVIVTDRTPKAVELYIALPAKRMPDVFGIRPEAITGPDGKVDFDALRLGTYELGDDVFANVSARLGGALLDFENMSLMLHPNEQALPLSTPLDGMIAIGVCTVPTPDALPGLEDLRSYLGFIAYTDRPDAEFRLDFPATGRADLRVALRDYASGRFVSARQVMLEDDGVLVVNAHAAGPPRTHYTLIVGALVVNILAIGAGVLLNRRRMGRSMTA